MSDHHSSAQDASQFSARFVNAARAFRRHRPASFTLAVGIGTTRLIVVVENGAVTRISDHATLRPLTAWDFSLNAEAHAWERFWEAVPAPGWHDIFALARNGHMRIEGNLHPFMAHLQFVKDLVASPRATP